MRIEHLINGKAVGAQQYFETVNPATQEVLAEVASGTATCLLYTSDAADE